MVLKNRKEKKVQLNAVSEVLTIAEVAENFDYNFEPAQIDLITDVNENFFSASNELIRQLVLANQVFVATKLKCYVDLLVRLHGRFVHEVDQNKKMRDKIEGAEEKLRLALDTTATSEEVMNNLRESLAEAWRVSDAALNREGMIVEQQSRVVSKDNIGNLSVKSAKQDDELGGPAKLRIAIFRERDRLNSEVIDYEKRLQENRFYATSLETIIDIQKETMSKQLACIRTLENEKYRIKRTLRLNQESFDDDMRACMTELNGCQTALKEFDTCKRNLGIQIKENELQQQANERLQRAYDVLKKNFIIVTNERNEIKQNLTTINETLILTRREKEDLKMQCKSVEREYKRVSDTLDLIQRKLDQASRKVGELNDIILTAKNKETNLVKKIYTIMVNLEDMTHLKDDIARSRDKARLDIVHLNDTITNMKHTELLQRNEIQKLRWNLDKFNKIIDEKQNQIHKLTREKNEMFSEVNELHEKNSNLLEQMEEKTARVMTLNEQLQLKHQAYMSVKKQMEAIHSEKVMLQKSLDLSTRDRLNLQNINTKMSHQVNQMTCEIGMNEKEIIQLKVRIERLNNTVKLKQTEITTIERLLSSTREELKECKNKNDQAQNTISEDEARIVKMHVEFEEMRKEKHLVGVQMVRRNDELLLLKDRLRIMQATIDNGTSQYNQRINDIRLLKQEITNLRLSNDCLTRAAVSTANMRNEIVRLDRELNRERLRVAAYAEELQRPCRIHYWRVVRSKDPHQYELLSKVQTLLKRNLKLSNLKTNMEVEITRLQKKYDLVCAQLRGVADPSIKERLNCQREINRKQVRKIKAMKAELAINEIDLKARECIIESYQETLKKSKQLGSLPSDVFYNTSDSYAYRCHEPSLVIGSLNEDCLLGNCSTDSDCAKIKNQYQSHCEESERIVDE